MNNEIDLQPKAILDLNAPQPKPWHSCSGSRPLLTKKQNCVFQDFPPNLHLIPQCDNGREETVLMKYGYDMRQPFAKTQEYPWSTLVFLQMTFPSYRKFALGQDFGQGSGTFIGPNIILTAAHNVRNINKAAETEEDLENLESIRITPEVYPKNVPFGLPRATYVLIPSQYTVKNLNYRDHDWALIIIDRPIGNETGWLGIASLTDEELKDRKMNLVGYPADKDQLKDRQLWGAGDTIKKIYPERFSYWIDTAKGQSGSGVWIWSHADKEPYIVGVHVFGNKSENQATRLTPAKFKQITSGIGEYAYKDPLYRSLENWSDDFWDKDETKLNEAQKQIVPHLLKEGPFMKENLKGFIEHSLKSGYLSIFTSINSSLSELELSGLQMGDEWVKVLAENKTWPNLQTLSLRGNNIGDEGAKALAANKTWTELLILFLSGNHIGDEGAKALAANQTWRLVNLSLKDNQIGDEGAKALAGRSNIENFLFLQLLLSGNPIGDETAKAITNKFSRSWLQPIIVTGEEQEVESLPGLLLKMIQTRYSESDILIKKEHDDVARKKREQLVNNCSQESDKKTIFIALFILPKRVHDQWLDTTLQDLDLFYQQINCEGAKIIATNKSWSLKKLNLSFNEIGDEGAKAIANNTVWPLEHLNLSSNGIRTDGAQALALNRQWRLKSLELRHNSFPLTQFVFFDSEIAKELKNRFGADVVRLKL